MQTFLPYPNFIRTAECLDNKRLGKQRVETLQIMNALLEGRGWVNHPATRMWAGFERCLLLYQEMICFEWVMRGYRDTCYVQTAEKFYDHRPAQPVIDPPWMNSARFHISHQSNLLRKNPQHYRQYFPDVPDDLPYVWPV